MNGIHLKKHKILEKLLYHPSIHNSIYSPLERFSSNRFNSSKQTHLKTNAFPSLRIEGGFLTFTDAGEQFAADANALDVLCAVGGMADSPLHRACQAVRRTEKGNTVSICNIHL